MMREWDIAGEIEGLSMDAVELTAWPVRRTSDEYQSAIERAVDTLSGWREVLAVYQIGGTSVPGISDIDLVAVLRDDSLRRHKSDDLLLTDSDKYLFMHGPFAIPESVFRQRALLIPMNNLVRLYGADIAEHQGTAGSATEHVAQMYAVEYMVTRLFDLARQLRSRRLKLRSLLCGVHALVYDFRLLSDFVAEDTWRGFELEIAGIRNHWFEDEVESAAAFFALCRRLPRLLLGTLASMLDQESAPIWSVGDMQSGINGYVQTFPAREAAATLLGRERRLARRDRPRASMLSVSRHLKLGEGLSQLSTAFVLSLGKPPLVDTGNAIMRERELAVSTRNQMLAEYARFMCRPIAKRFSPYDVMRWYPARSRKWDAVRLGNRVLVGPGPKTRARSHNA